MRRHEAHHARHPCGLHVGRNIDEGERGKAARPDLAFSNQSGQPAQRGADERGGRAQPVRHAKEIVCKILDAIMARRRPVAFAMTAQIDRNGSKSRSREPFLRAAPAQPCLPAAMRQQYRWRASVPSSICRERLPFGSGECDLLDQAHLFLYIALQ